MLVQSIVVIGKSHFGDISTLLVECNYRVETAVAPTDLSKLASETRFLLAFLYMDAPDLLDYVRKFRRTSKNRRTPLIGLINEKQREQYDEVVCLQAGCSDYLALPVVPDNLKLILQRWIT